MRRGFGWLVGVLVALLSVQTMAGVPIPRIEDARGRFVGPAMYEADWGTFLVGLESDGIEVWVHFRRGELQSANYFFFTNSSCSGTPFVRVYDSMRFEIQWGVIQDGIVYGGDLDGPIYHQHVRSRLYTSGQCYAFDPWYGEFTPAVALMDLNRTFRSPFKFTFSPRFVP